MAEKKSSLSTWLWGGGLTVLVTVLAPLIIPSLLKGGDDPRVTSNAEEVRRLGDNYSRLREDVKRLELDLSRFQGRIESITDPAEKRELEKRIAAMEAQLQGLKEQIERRGR